MTQTIEERRTRSRNYMRAKRKLDPALDSRYRANHREKISEVNKRYRKNHPEKVAESLRMCRSRKREMAHAQARAEHEKMFLRNPGYCGVCGRSLISLEKHHPNYALPLDVIWLCHECHIGIFHPRAASLEAACKAAK